MTLYSRQRRVQTWLRIGTTVVGAAATALFGTTTAVYADPVSPSSSSSTSALPQALAAAVTCGYNGADNQWMTRSNAVTRARSWIGKTPYSQSKCYRNAYGDYRTDCSGMVAMAWGLGGNGSDWWTGNLNAVSTPIPAAQLQAGDALLYHDGTSNGSHVALFAYWADSAHTRPVVVQETGSADNTIEGEPTNFNWHNYTPIRYDRILNDAPRGPLIVGSGRSDFSGDGKADVATLTQGSTGDVLVGVSSGSGFASGVKWHDMFSLAGEIPMSGDFNGDGKDDLATFTQGTTGDVLVALSNGTSFASGVKWHDMFSLAGEIPAVGDFNGDGKDDLATFTQGTTGDVLVALSNGTSFASGVKWHDMFSLAGEIPAVGDFNGDGKDDLATFTQGTTGDVLVALSNGTSFASGVKWHDMFSLAGEIPAVGDFNGDGKDDLATFTQGTTGDVLVALSNGTSFASGVKWHDMFSLAGEIPAVGDFNGDGKDDLATFTQGTTGDVLVALSNGTSFASGVKWHDMFSLAGEWPLPSTKRG